MVQHVTQIRRAPRPGRPDGASEAAVYGVHWTDEDTGAHWATVRAQDEQAVRDLFEPLIGSNSMVIRQLSA